MDTNTNLIEIGRRFFDAFNEKDVNTIETLWEPNYKIHMGFLPDPSGPHDHINLIKSFLTAFPDLKITVEDTIQSGNKVLFRGKATGTHRADFQGIPATNKRMEITYIDIMEFSDKGKVKDDWVQMDALKLMQQIGAVPQM